MSVGHIIRVAAIDTAIVEGGKRCRHCDRVKPRAAFYRHGEARDGLSSWCRTCFTVAKVLRGQTPEGRAKATEYNARPEVKARKRAWDAAWALRHPDLKHAWRRTPRGRLISLRAQHRRRFRAAADPARRAKLEDMIAQYDAEIARVDAAEGRIDR